MENAQEPITKEEIYSCIKCHCPLSSSLSVRKTEHNYEEIIKSYQEISDPNKYKCIFVIPASEINSTLKKFTYDIDFENKKIICKKGKETVGKIHVFEDDEFVDMKFTIGFLDMEKVEATEVGFQTKKEIPVYSQQEYTVLAKLKQLRYFVKQLGPTLETSMNYIKTEQDNIFQIQDKFDKYKLHKVLNKCKEIQKIIDNDGKEDKNDK